MDITEKIQKMIEAAGQLKSGVLHMVVNHDNDCPAINTQNLVDCTCNPEFKAVVPNS
jgi:thiamine phosphate synthase YjbQ (UPF0047 family)